MVLLANNTLSAQDDRDAWTQTEGRRQMGTNRWTQTNVGTHTAQHTNPIQCCWCCRVLWSDA
jgi:hypothetical protein